VLICFQFGLAFVLLSLLEWRQLTNFDGTFLETCPMTHDATPRDSSAPVSVSRRSAFGFWLKLGFISFGGPAGQIAIMHQELVERRRWLSEQRFLHALNYCMLLPGPEAQQLATYIGWLLHRTWGGLVAGLLFILPSFFLLVALAWVYVAYGELPWVAAIFYGIKPAVTVIVLQAAHRMGRRTLHNPLLWSIAIAAFVAIFVFRVPFPLIVIAAALAGFVGNRWLPDRFGGGDEKLATRNTWGPAVIDDQSPPQPHTLFRWSRLLLVLITGALCWLLPMALLFVVYGWSHPFTQMSWFFTKAALLTFGGAYAVLPYVYQGAVSHFGWVTPGQMIDGLALGESTPGPLIMLVVFVAFLGGVSQAPWGQGAVYGAGALAALLVCWFTFLPSFVFIFAGAPFIETTHKNLGFKAPLAAITAAVVGVIVNLAIFFAWHIFWPQGWEGGLDIFSLAIALVAGVALLVFRLGMMPVLAGSVVAGLLVELVLRPAIA
jgi:chromate transporter